MIKENYVTVDGTAWQWAEDYLGATAAYVIACSPGRTCQIGMGVMALGEPRGEKIRFSGEREIMVIGAGALHFRVDDGAGACRVGFAVKSVTPIKWDWTY
jgi:hypothetical protein